MQMIRKGDKVQIIRGADRPQTEEERKQPSGEVIAVDLIGERCKVSGKNLVWKHKRGTQEEEGGRKQIEQWLPLCNVMLFNEESGTAERARVNIDDDGRRSRVWRKSGKPVDN